MVTRYSATSVGITYVNGLLNAPVVSTEIRPQPALWRVCWSYIFTFTLSLGIVKTHPTDSRTGCHLVYDPVNSTISYFIKSLYGTEDILSGTPITNRNRSELEGLIGFFVNTSVLKRLQSGESDFMSY